MVQLLRVLSVVAVFALVLAIGIAGAQSRSQSTEQSNFENSAPPYQTADQLTGLETNEKPPALATAELFEKIHMPFVFDAPTPTATPTEVPEPAWLAYVNRFRVSTGLLPLDENESWSNGGWLHSRYMVKNDYVGHREVLGNPWYTVEGDTAAQNGNVYVSWWADTTDERPIDFWMTAPFHAISVLDPQLRTTGFGVYREAIGNWKTGSTLDVSRGRGDLPQGTTFPIPYPADGGTTWLNAYYGGEFPDPLTSCPGYSAPTGPPIMLQLGSGDLTPQVLSHRVLVDGVQLDSCIFDETNYVNSDYPNQQYTGRIVLNNRDAVVIMPRDPLVAGKTYFVEVTTVSSTTNWSFTVDSDAIGSHEAIPPLSQVGSVAPHYK
jgi:uncharacterized protein YkwD